MPLIVNEQQEKKESFILKYDSNNTLKIKSNLYKLPFHYLNEQKRSVSCHGDKCIFCEKNVARRHEYNYYVVLNGKSGVMDIKTTVFFAMNAIEKAGKKDKRFISWLVIKSGQGKETQYTASKDDNLSKEECDKVVAETPAYNEKLEKFMKGREASLEEEYYNFAPDFGETPEKKQSPEEAEEEISNDDIPF